MQKAELNIIILMTSQIQIHKRSTNLDTQYTHRRRHRHMHALTHWKYPTGAMALKKRFRKRKWFSGKVPLVGLVAEISDTCMCMEVPKKKSEVILTPRCFV